MANQALLTNIPTSNPESRILYRVKTEAMEHTLCVRKTIPPKKTHSSRSRRRPSQRAKWLRQKQTRCEAPKPGTQFLPPGSMGRGCFGRRRFFITAIRLLIYRYICRHMYIYIYYVYIYILCILYCFFCDQSMYLFNLIITHMVWSLTCCVII